VNLGRSLIVSGLLLACLGVIVLAAGRFHLPFGRLPGDVVLRGKRTTFYFPIVTCLVLSLLGSLVLWLLNRR
jgi:hypothetical protein